MKLLPLVFLATYYGSAHGALPVNLDVSITLPIVGELNLARLGHVKHIDQSRAQILKNRLHASTHHQRRDASIDATNTAVDFTVTVNIGEPATPYTLLLDSGSANTWVGAKQKYSPTSSSKNTGKAVHVSYGSGRFSGTQYTDKVDLGNGLVVNNQQIGVANTTSGFDGSFDGILGIGPADLTEGTVTDSHDAVPTIPDNLNAQGVIATEILGMFYPPYAETTTGAVSFGAPDASKFTGELSYVPITKSSPAGDYWGVDQSIKYGDKVIADMSSGIVDSGTTMILLASDHFDAYKSATGAVEDSKTGMLSLAKDQFAKLQPLNFVIGGKTWALSANGQIWPRSLNKALGGDDDHVYLVVHDLGSKSGEGFDFINGYHFMQRFYTVFDTTNSQVGFAKTQYTDSEAN